MGLPSWERLIRQGSTTFIKTKMLFRYIDNSHVETTNLSIRMGVVDKESVMFGFKGAGN